MANIYGTTARPLLGIPIPLNKRLFKGIAVAVAFMVVQGGSLFAQEVAIPNIQKGDRWVDRVVDESGAPTGETRTMTIADVDNDTLTVDEEIAGGQVVRFLLDHGLNIIWQDFGEGKETYKPRIVLLKFPLAPSETWSERYMWTQHGNRWAHADADGKVVGWEEVTVPAGKFHALHVTWKSEGEMTTWLQEFWIAPEVRRWVKRKDGRYGSTELVSYKLVPDQAVGGASTP